MKPGITLTALVQKGDEQKRMLTEVFRDELGGLGVKVDFVEATWPAIFKRATDWSASGPGLNWHVVAFYKSPDLWTPWTFLYRMFHSETQVHKPSGQWNFVSYANPAVDKLMDDANLTMDPAKAAVLWRKANEQIYAEMPAIPIEKMVEIAVLRSNIHGYQVSRVRQRAETLPLRLVAREVGERPAGDDGAGVRAARCSCTSAAAWPPSRS